jgi:hypothetical protein
MPANGWEGIRPADWDIVVSRAQELDSYARMHVLAFGCTRLETILAREGSVSVYYRGGQPSQKMTVPDDLPRPLRRLITSELIPYLQALPERPYLKYPPWYRADIENDARAHYWEAIRLATICPGS